MESSRRAVESYWRSRMIDASTSDEDKVTPVYKLDEICELLRSSHASIVREVSEFILKRLDHKSPIVKQKALRLIKYTVGKSGSEFRREMQRHSVAVRQLLHYKGHPDPLKGDALNKAVRDTAQEALSSIFSTDDSKPAPSEDLNKRIQGFGSTNTEMPPEDKRSFLSEVVGLGSASIKQGLSTFTQGNSQKKSDTGSYKSPTLRRSLTSETDYPDRFERMDYPVGSEGSSGISATATAGPWGQDSILNNVEAVNGNSSSGYSEGRTREERLLETIVTSGGVRLQPTRDAIQAFLAEAVRVDALALSRAFELKLRSSQWQVRMKAVCVLEAVLRKDDVEHFSAVASYFTENKDVVVRCSESPQASLREKANKVLNLLGGDRTEGGVGHSGKLAKSETKSMIEMPDLIDTRDPDYSEKVQTDMNPGYQSSSTIPLIDDLFGDMMSTGVETGSQKINDDLFADVSFYTNNDREQCAESTDLFVGMNIRDNPIDVAVDAAKNNRLDPFDIFGPNYSKVPQQQENHNDDVSSVMAGLSISSLNDSGVNQNGQSPATFPEKMFSNSSDSVNIGLRDPQTAAMNANTMFPMGIMFNQSYPSHLINYGAMGSFLAQQQLLAAMANFQTLGSLSSQNADISYTAGTRGGYSSAHPDIFHASTPTQAAITVLNSSKEETKAFDFISDHLAAARDLKRVI
ncbi:hypothetical protein Nepgr_024061 [Nepenthes gracilis]|uniref:VHS domain-containing protein n=1 Tax=Nepenthes gracilis TaxID=150966 RepID=A0AAD3T234_NEPGR|nr:hypothetical protein Nepgr_024061 [Nepenthes gracilis]